MKTKLILLALFALIPLAGPCLAQDASSSSDQELENIVKNLKYKHGEIDLVNGIARLNVPEDFNYLDAADARTVLTKLWDNPPDSAPGMLGMIMPANTSPMDADSWGVLIFYKDEGYVKDNDASTIDYNSLLKQMQASTLEGNKSRVNQGYKPLELIGWATPPHYDAATHKLYWAKELKVGDNPNYSLNYDIRILGRRGHLVLSAIASMNQLSVIEQNNPKILSMVNFNDGNRYTDFDPKVDKVAEYGIAALVVGGIAAKAGLFKILLGLLAAGYKFVAVGFVALVASIKRLFGRGKNTGVATSGTPPGSKPS